RPAVGMLANSRVVTSRSALRASPTHKLAGFVLSSSVFRSKSTFRRDIGLYDRSYRRTSLSTSLRYAGRGGFAIFGFGTLPGRGWSVGGDIDAFTRREAVFWSKAAYKALMRFGSVESVCHSSKVGNVM